MIEYCDPLAYDSIGAGIFNLARMQEEPEMIRQRKEHAGKFSYNKAASGYSALIDKFCGANRNT